MYLVSFELVLGLQVLTEESQKNFNKHGKENIIIYKSNILFLEQ